MIDPRPVAARYGPGSVVSELMVNSMKGTPMNSLKTPAAAGTPHPATASPDPGEVRAFADLDVPTPEQAAEFIELTGITRENLVEAYAAEGLQTCDAEPVELLRALVDSVKTYRRPPADPTLGIILKWRSYRGAQQANENSDCPAAETAGPVGCTNTAVLRDELPGQQRLFGLA